MKTYVLTYEGSVYAVVQADESVDVGKIVSDWCAGKLNKGVPLKNLLYVLRQAGVTEVPMH